VTTLGAPLPLKPRSPTRFSSSPVRFCSSPARTGPRTGGASGMRSVSPPQGPCVVTLNGGCSRQAPAAAAIPPAGSPQVMRRTTSPFDQASRNRRASQVVSPKPLVRGASPLSTSRQCSPPRFTSVASPLRGTSPPQQSRSSCGAQVVASVRSCSPVPGRCSRTGSPMAVLHTSLGRTLDNANVLAKFGLGSFLPSGGGPLLAAPLTPMPAPLASLREWRGPSNDDQSPSPPMPRRDPVGELSLPPFFYEADPTDSMDVALLQELVALNLEVSARLNIKRLRPGEYEIEGVRVRLSWQNEELFVHLRRRAPSRRPQRRLSRPRDAVEEDEQEGSDGADVAEMPLAAYLRQLANVDQRRLALMDPQIDSAVAAAAFAGATGGGLPTGFHGGPSLPPPPPSYAPPPLFALATGPAPGWASPVPVPRAASPVPVPVPRAASPVPVPRAASPVSAHTPLGSHIGPYHTTAMAAATASRVGASPLRV